MSNYFLFNSMSYHRMESLQSDDKKMESLLEAVISLLEDKNNHEPVYKSSYNTPVVEVRVGSQTTKMTAPPPVLISSGATLEEYASLSEEEVAIKIADQIFDRIKQQKEEELGLPVELFTIDILKSHVNPMQPLMPSLLVAIRMF